MVHFLRTVTIPVRYAYTVAIALSVFALSILIRLSEGQVQQLEQIPVQGNCMASTIEGSEQVCEASESIFIFNSTVDYEKSTEDNYSTDEAICVGKFASQRALLDYSYHKHWIPERQLFQDTIIDRFKDTVVHDSFTGMTCSAPLHNWIIFTAGAMGVGKTRVLRELWRQGDFPLDSFVWVDLDAIRTLLPEWGEYSRREPLLAGRRTQKESSYIGEVMTMQALQKGQNVLVDSSLKDAKWHEMYFKQLRLLFPSLKIGIFKVNAREETVLERARKRGEITGRIVPIDILLSSLTVIPGSFTYLTPFSDFVAVFENEDNEPLRISHISERSETKLCTSSHDNSIDSVPTFDAFRDVWKMTCPM